MNKLKLGTTVIDNITECVGIAVVIAEYLGGNVVVGIQGKKLGSGVVPPISWVNISRVEVLEIADDG